MTGPRGHAGEAPARCPRGHARGGRVERARRRAEDGGVALLTLCGGVVLLMAGLLVLSAVADIGVAAARARTVADAAALAAVSSPLPATGIAGIAGCDLARQLAEVNGASLVTCSVPAAGAALVEVGVRPRTPLVRRLVGDLPARAAAVLEPYP